MAQLTNNADVDLLFSQYVDVVNQVLSENKNGFYGKVLKLWERLGSDPSQALGVYECDPDEVIRWYTIKLSDGRFEIVSNDKEPDVTFTAKVRIAYLENVVNNPEVYIKNPFKLDLHWLKSRLQGC